MTSGRVLYHMVRADFLERVRRYSFLLTLALATYLGYAAGTGRIKLALDQYQGVFNSAWCGSMMTLVSTTFLTLVGFYIVKNSLQRDEKTRVGQILAATPMTRSVYTLAKALSNFAVLALMLGVLAVAAALLQLSRAGDTPFQPAALLAPFVWVGLPAMAFTASLAVVFETVPILRTGLGNVIYFFAWTAGLGMGVNSRIDDLVGFNVIGRNMQAALRRIDPAYKDDLALTVGNRLAPTKTFLWNGVAWTEPVIVHRLAWSAIAAGLALVAAMFFHRFDPARRTWTWRARPALPQNGSAEEMRAAAVVAIQKNAVRLSPVARSAPQSQWIHLIGSELRLMLKGLPWWWYAGAAGMFVACLLSPLESAKGVLIAAWLWPVLLWSQMGAREARFATGSLVFSSRHTLQHQFPAVWIAGVLVTALTGGAMGVRLVLARDWRDLASWSVAVVFIPSLALACGVWSGNSKLFEGLYTAWWYVGVANRTPDLDFVGLNAESGRPLVYLALTGVLLAAAYLGRRRQMAYA